MESTAPYKIKVLVKNRKEFIELQCQVLQIDVVRECQIENFAPSEIRCSVLWAVFLQLLSWYF